MSGRGRRKRERARQGKTIVATGQHVEMEALEAGTWRREDIADKPNEWLLMRGDVAVLRIRQR